jgi:CRP-like cAMP-binding protein
MFRVVRLNEGEWLFSTGDPGRSLYLIYHGMLKMYLEKTQRNSMDSDTKFVEVSYRRGEIVGEVALLLKSYRTSSVQSEMNCVLLELDDFEFQHLLDNFPVLGDTFTKIARKNITEDLSHFDVALLQSLNKQQLNELANLSTMIQIPPGEVIYEEGDVGDRFYIIVSGKVGLFYNKSSQKRLELSRIGRGTYFGEASLIRDELRRETARAISHCVILSITRKKFQEFLSCNQEFEVEFQVKMAKHQVELESFENIANLSLMTKTWNFC